MRQFFIPLFIVVLFLCLQCAPEDEPEEATPELCDECLNAAPEEESLAIRFPAVGDILADGSTGASQLIAPHVAKSALWRGWRVAWSDVGARVLIQAFIPKANVDLPLSIICQYIGIICVVSPKHNAVFKALLSTIGFGLCSYGPA